MAASLSKSAMGSCINGHISQNDSTMMDSQPAQEKVAILDAGAQYGKVINAQQMLFTKTHFSANGCCCFF